MKLLRRNNTEESRTPLRFRNEPYLILNFFFAGIVILVIAYSGIFSPDINNYPVVCIHEKLTGRPCFSCGLSHSLSLIVRGRITEAYTWNIFGMRVFLFFAFQLILRIVFSISYIRRPDTQKQLIILDSVGSGALFLLTFWPFIENIVKTFFSTFSL
jgi:hypothetical protein